MVQKAKIQKMKRSENSDPSGFVGNLIKFQDHVPIKKSKIQDGLTDLTFHCQDGSVNAHQLIVASNSKFLKRLFLEQHSFEFAMIDWNKSIAQLTGRRASSQPIEIHLPDFTKEDIKRVLSCFYTGQMLIENEVQSLALKNLWRTLGIDSIKLSDLDFMEIDDLPKAKKSLLKNEERPPKSTPQKKSTPKTPNKAKTPAKKSATPSKKSPERKSKPRGRPSKDSQDDIMVIDEDEPPAKKRPPSPLPKAVSLKSPQKSNVPEKFLTIKCENCQQTLKLHRHERKGNLTKYQMHVISCYQIHLFADVPSFPTLEKYYCPHPEEKCKVEMKNRISFLFHLALNHMEFYPRIMRLLNHPEQFKNAPLNQLKNIVTNLKEYPTLKYDTTECPDFDHVTNEVQIYEAFEKSSKLTKKWQCKQQHCKQVFKNLDFAVLHQFIIHQVKFLNEHIIPNVSNLWFSCADCDFVTYSKSDFIAHLGHFHSRFEEIKSTLNTKIHGNIAWQSLFNLTQGSGYMQNQQTSIEVKFQYDQSSGRLYCKCQKCQLDLWAFKDLKRHMSQDHIGAPVKCTCQDCARGHVYQVLPAEEKLKTHRCGDHIKNGKVHHQPLEPAHTVFIPMDQKSDEADEELIEID